ncbi:uncharacterized protein LOC131332653 [Rhododendron vialii]|uniref:uncharacterized protein LOC131332653 n=1 Tax=Rhododendron vialii TaxID=182163 RepID=UPI00265F4A40|nr:uncharacterized protein LOC131332653 [Rhododendron vialii]
MKVPYDCSWTVRKILKLRGLGQNFVKHHIGNGLGTSLWYDNWHPWGPLYKILDDRTVSRLGTAASATVSSVISNGIWHWPRPRNNLIHQIQMAIPGNLVPQIEMEDEVRWHISPNGQYTTKHTWEAIRSKSEKVPWASLVWFPRNVPKWAFILWLACLKRLSTKDRLRKWGMEVDPTCVLCSQADESLQHLFFHCCYSSNIWEVILYRFQIQRKADLWNSEVSWAIHFCRGNSFQSLLFKLVFAAAVYHIWMERNSRIFGGRSRCAPEVLDSIDEYIRSHVYSWKVIPSSVENQSMCELWKLPRRIFGPGIPRVL